MPGYNFFNLGNAVQAGEQIKSSQLRNKILGMEVENQQDIIRNRQKAREIREQFDTMPQQIEALETAGMYDEAAKMRDSYIKAKRASVEMLTTMRDTIDADNYKQVRQDLIQAGAVEPTMMPTEYSDSWMRKLVEKEKGNLQRLTRTWSEQGATMSQDLVAQDGEILWSGTPYQKGSDGGGGKDWKMSSGDSNAIRNATAELYGSVWDPQSKRYAGLNRDQTVQVASIAEEASRIYNANKGRLPHAEAVARAARKMNIQIQNLNKDPANKDPLGIR